MKVNFIKMPGGILSPANDIESNRLNRLKNGIVYEVELKGGERRNRGFHGKVFMFFTFCFNHWAAENTDFKYQCESAQFDSFRKYITISAGFFDWVVDLDGTPRMKAQSLSFDSMDQEYFEQCYSALINAAIAQVFNNTNDEQILNKLQSFF